MDKPWNFAKSKSTKKENVVRKEAEQLKDVPRIVLNNKKRYNFQTVLVPGTPVLTEDRKRAEKMPNFQDLTKHTTVVSTTEKVYGPWGEPLEGIAPEVLIKQESAKQIEDKVLHYDHQLEIMEGAEKISVNYVSPDENPLSTLHTDDLEKVPTGAKVIALENHRAIPVPYQTTDETILGYASETQIPAVATKMETTREISMGSAFEFSKTVFSLDEIKDEKAKNYAKNHPLVNREKERFDEPKETDTPMELTISEKIKYIPFVENEKEYFELVDGKDALNQSLRNRYSEEETNEIVEVACEKSFYFPPEQTGENQAVTLPSGASLKEWLIKEGYNDADAHSITRAAEVEKMELSYDKPQYNGAFT